MNEAEVACCRFIVLGGETAGAFHLVGAAHDAASQSIRDAFDRFRRFWLALVGMTEVTPSAVIESVADVFERSPCPR